jgi:hypothetical protein
MPAQPFSLDANLSLAERTLAALLLAVQQKDKVGPYELERIYSLAESASLLNRLARERCQVRVNLE